ncbi:MAG: bifunctional phosphoglucose/phosphomannose isomerase [Candidatus Colwellbacteria bacterium]|nr:bifunctional phosphoglucose/phosphomannose isomerase [Candidatus Colwellbacteria bacterium]
MLEDSIKSFPKQFAFEPEIKNAEKIRQFESLVIGGMGGSGLIAGILRALKPELDIAAHHDYGLPAYLKDADKRLLIAISYSGNTEETISFFNETIAKNLNIAVIAVGGKLLQLAQEKGIPFVQLPDTGIQPRMSIGFMLRAVLKLTGESRLYKESGKLANTLKPGEWETKGKELADTIFKHIPIIYSSRRNIALAYNWKIKFNETGKAPAFYNTFPELNHNEMTGFDVKDSTKELSDKMFFIFLKDKDDHPKITKRMEVLERLYRDRKLSVAVVSLEGNSKMEKIFNSLILADWTAYYTAKRYNVEPEQVPMVEEFKKLL